MTINCEGPAKGPSPIRNLSLRFDKLGLKGRISGKLCLSLIFFMLTMFSEMVVC